MLNPSFERFDWDQGDPAKCAAHGVTVDEIEGAFVSEAMMIVPDPKHSEDEDRYTAAGRARSGRHLFVAFTFRTVDGRRALRPITARYMHQKEAQRYEQARAQIEK